MSFFIVLFIFLAVLLGANFCILLAGGIPFKKGVDFKILKFGKRYYSDEMFAIGVSIFVFGAGWLSTLIYLLATGWDAMANHLDSIIVHVVLQFASAVALVISGVAIFAKWKRRKELFLTSAVILFGSLAISLFAVGPKGNDDATFLYHFGLLSFVAAGFLSVGTFLLDRVVKSFSLSSN